MPDHTDDSTADDTRTSRLPSIPLLVAGLASLVLAAITLVGVDPGTAFSGDRPGWFLVIPAIVVGVLLLIVPARSRSRRRGSD